VNDIRDGVSLNRQRQLRPIVLPTEIQFLPDLVGYLKLGRSFPVAQFKLKRKELEKIAEGYITRDMTPAPPENVVSIKDAKPTDYVDGALF
jgi:hypothetical protein